MIRTRVIAADFAPMNEQLSRSILAPEGGCDRFLLDPVPSLDMKSRLAFGVLHSARTQTSSAEVTTS
ncbi:MAG: hypothetical protein HY674_00655 [Chloroflexi bacterium]|nr:hypothetical protein [Chloroflexota bacterium]